MRVAVYTLGCKVNTYESETILSDFRKAGARIVPFDSAADVYIVNTCSVTQMADKKSRQILHRARRSNPNAVIVATGCYIQRKPSDLPQDAVDFIVYNEDKNHFYDLVMDYIERHTDLNFDSDARITNCNDENADHEAENGIYEHTRAFLKIQDGCRQFCAYCIIPYLRGELHSIPVDIVEQEARKRVDRGYKEIVLTGIHLSSYGRKGTFPEPEQESSLADLINHLSQIEGLERIRLGSLEPGIVTDEFVSKLSGQKKLCPHFHLSLQSGCQRTLKAMNRHYTPDEYLHAVELIRSAWPEAAFTTDVIVGFPGETEQDFEESEAFVRKVGFSQLHIFKYSRREGTAAARRSEQIDERIKNVRSEKLIHTGFELSGAYASRWIGHCVEVLLEENTEQGWVGYTRHYLRVRIPNAGLEQVHHDTGELVKLRICDVQNDQNEVTLIGMEDTNCE